MTLPQPGMGQEVPCTDDEDADDAPLASVDVDGFEEALWWCTPGGRRVSSVSAISSNSDCVGELRGRGRDLGEGGGVGNDRCHCYTHVLHDGGESVLFCEEVGEVLVATEMV